MQLLANWEMHQGEILQFLNLLLDTLVYYFNKDSSSSILEIIKDLGVGYARLQISLNRSSEQMICDYQGLHEAILAFIESKMRVSVDDYRIIRSWMNECLVHGVRERIAIMYEEVEEEKALREIFVLSVAHDLRSPLTGIRANAELILRYPDRQERSLTLAGRIVAGTARLDRMVSNLLDANQIRAGNPLVLNLSQEDLVKLVQDTIENLSTTHGSRFILDLPETLNCFCNRDGLQRVLENLVTNGLKYGLQKSSILVKLMGLGQKIYLSVHNSGNPIPIEDQANLFRLFGRTPSAKSSGKSGWGIGLVLVKGIVEAHGGEVQVSSDLESGTTFTIVIPQDSRLS